MSGNTFRRLAASSGRIAICGLVSAAADCLTVRSRINRHLAHEFDTSHPGHPPPPVHRRSHQRVSATRTPSPPDEFSWRDYAVFLLHVAAEIEHTLMVQYLFAAYSLGGTPAAVRHEREVRQWQETILGIAQEEMGHLLTVQNVLIVLGGPLCFDRQDYPWDSEFYPFTFNLRRLTLGTLAAYVCAESPPNWKSADREEIRTAATVAVHAEVNGVGRLYLRLEEIVGDQARIPDAAFQPATVSRQATRDEWARGHLHGVARSEPGNVTGVKQAELLIAPCSSRDDAVQALRAIGEQGEAINHIPAAVAGTQLAISTEESHFHRFLRTYRAMRALGKDANNVSRNIADNPRTRHIHDIAMKKTHVAQPFTWHRNPVNLKNPPANVITNREARAWAHLFNLRYRFLLVNLNHALQHPGAAANGRSSTRGYLINRTFGEMYNLRSIAGRLVQLPLMNTGGQFAGPPFEMPYTLVIPDGELDRWRLHRDLYVASHSAVQSVEHQLSGKTAFADQSRAFLDALDDSDQRSRAQVEAWISSGTGSQPSTVST